MHIERNFSANIIKHLFGKKDTVATRRDMEDVNRMEELWLRRRGASENFFQPSTPYVFMDSERRQFLELIGSNQVWPFPLGLGGCVFLYLVGAV